jgi:hypothetical protein
MVQVPTVEATVTEPMDDTLTKEEEHQSEKEQEDPVEEVKDEKSPQNDNILDCQYSFDAVPLKKSSTHVVAYEMPADSFKLRSKDESPAKS